MKRKHKRNLLEEHIEYVYHQHKKKTKPKNYGPIVRLIFLLWGLIINR